MRRFSDCTWLTGEGSWRKRCNMKQVTVIVPIYKVEKYLRTCFESLKAQTSDEFVVMAVDDGSPDGCGKIIDEYTAAYPGLITGIHKENGGYGSVLELAIKTCTTPYFMICDPDDTLQPNAVENLPIGVCGWAVIFCSFMVIGKTQSLFDISYFWLLSGSVFALLTPTPLNFTGPTRFRYYQFWAEHTLGYVAIFYMIFVHGMRPTVKSAVRSYAALLVFAVIAYSVNRMIPGANYLYMAKPEDAPSVLDILPPNFALRICVMASVILVMQGLAYLPWYLKDRKAAKEKQLVA